MKKLGFIGMGNMAQALATGFIKSGSIEKADVFAYAPHQDKLQKNAQRIGFTPCSGLRELAEKCDTLVMACKPYQIEDVIAEIKDVLPGKALVSIAAGWDFARYEKALPKGVRVQFIMPNTPAMVGEGVLLFEETRKSLRDLIKFLVEPIKGQPPVITRLTDPVLSEQEGVQLDAGYNFEDYRKKVNRYIEENGNALAIYKLKHNIQLAPADYRELERVLTEELGSKEDYHREFGDTPFGLLVRKIAKLDHDAAMAAFSEFINDEKLNQRQIAFVNKIINHVEQNGYMESIMDLQKPPFDKPVSFIKLFDVKTRTALMQTIQSITDNAVTIA